MLALRLDKLPGLVRHRRSNARKREGAVRRARPGSPRMFEPLVELVVPHIVVSFVARIFDMSSAAGKD